MNPDQLRRLARRAIETIEPDQAAVDAHEDDLLRTEEATARDACSLTFHDNQDGTTTGHFTIPTLAAAILRKVIESMTAPRRMRPGVSTGSTDDHRAFDWRHRRGLAFAELLEHLPTRAQPEAEPRRRKRTGGAQRGMFGLRHLGDHHTPTATAQPDPARDLSQRESSAAERAVRLHTLVEPGRVGSPTRPKPYILRCAPPVRL